MQIHEGPDWGHTSDRIEKINEAQLLVGIEPTTTWSVDQVLPPRSAQACLSVVEFSRWCHTALNFQIWSECHSMPIKSAKLFCKTTFSSSEVGWSPWAGNGWNSFTTSTRGSSSTTGNNQERQRPTVDSLVLDRTQVHTATWLINLGYLYSLNFQLP